jgi:hypothetical protein
MADGPIARLRPLAGHRNDRADLLGRVRRRRSGPRRVDQPLEHRHPIAAIRHRLRQRRTVFGHTSSSSALSRTPTPSAASNMMRARRASCCGVEWVRTSCSSTSRCSGETITGAAANRGMTTSHLSDGFVMPQHERFGLGLQVSQNDPPLPGHRTCQQGEIRSAEHDTRTGAGAPNIFCQSWPASAS